MPFKKRTDGKYQTPSGKVMTRKQVRAYQATGGFNRPYKGLKKASKKS